MKARKCLIRLDAGKSIGLGHLSRNLTIAKQLKHYSEITFLICIDCDESFMKDWLRNVDSDFEFIFRNIKDLDIQSEIDLIRPMNFDFIIIDHYNSSMAYQLNIEKLGVPFAKFDHKNSEKILADMIINSNIGVDSSDYKGIVKQKAILCVGKDYLIIRDVFLTVDQTSNNDTILFSMGGGQYPDYVNEFIIEVVKNNKNHKFNVVTTSTKIIEELHEESHCSVYNNPSNIETIFASCSLAFVAGGVTTYELVYLNKPLVVLPFAVNQINNAIEVTRLNWGKCFLDYNECKIYLDEFGLKGLINECTSLLKTSLHKIDGLGVDRIVNQIQKSFL